MKAELLRPSLRNPTCHQKVANCNPKPRVQFCFLSSHDLNRFFEECKETTSSVVVSNFTAAASPASNSVCHIHVVKQCRETQELDVVVEALPNFNRTNPYDDSCSS
jgi:hypothetical protein